MQRLQVQKGSRLADLQVKLSARRQQVEDSLVDDEIPLNSQFQPPATLYLIHLGVCRVPRELQTHFQRVFYQICA